MADLIITIPDENVPMVADAVRWKTNTPGMTDQEANAWVKSYLTGILKQFVRRYQEQNYMDGFTYNDPIP